MKSPLKHLITVREFTKDFVFKLEFKAALESTAAVTVRGYPYSVCDFIRRGERIHPKKFHNDGWNEMEVTVKMVAYAGARYLTDSDHLEATFLNGKATAKVNGATVDPNSVAIHILGHYKVNDEGMVNPALPTKGQITLQTGSGKIEFRNIRFRELP